MKSAEKASDLLNDARGKISFIASRVKTLEVGQWTAIENLGSEDKQQKEEASSSLAGIYAFLGDIWKQLDEVYDILDSINLSKPVELSEKVV